MKKTLYIAVISAIALCSAWIYHRTDFDIGRVLDNQGNGKLYNGEPFYNYIAYDESRFRQDDIVLTFCFLNPLNNTCDDIIYRFDSTLFKNI